MNTRTINNQYTIKKKLSQGSYGVVFEGEDIINKLPVAIKIEKKEKSSTLDREIHLLTRLQGTQGVPKMYWSGIDNGCNVIVLQLLNKDLGAYLKEYRKFSLKTVLLIADQLLHIIRRIHNKSIVHRDLKPENIMVCNRAIYIVDYGISKLYRDTNLKHMPFKEGRPFVGTTRYASIAAHKGQELGRKDDVEGLLYVLLLLYKGVLPWQNMQGASNKERQKIVGDKKIKISPQELFADCPIEFARALEYIRGLQFNSDPDYDYIILMFRKLAQNNGIQYDDQFDWTPLNDSIPQQTSSISERQVIQLKSTSVQVPTSHNEDQVKLKQSLLSLPSVPNLQHRDTIISNSVRNSYILSQNQIQEEDINTEDYAFDDEEDINDTLWFKYISLKEKQMSTICLNLLKNK